MIDKQTQLAWLDKQRSIANDMIVNLPPDEQGSLLPVLQVINAIAERVQEMSAVEYLEAHQKMCVEHLNIDNFPPSACTGCPLENPHCNCEYFALHYPRHAVEIVKKWKEEQDELRH